MWKFVRLAFNKFIKEYGDSLLDYVDCLTRIASMLFSFSHVCFIIQRHENQQLMKCMIKDKYIQSKIIVNTAGEAVSKKEP